MNENRQKKKRNDKWAFGFPLIPRPHILCLHRTGKKRDERQNEWPHATHVFVRGMCCLVNRALIALALQLGNFLSNKAQAANKEDILKVLKCVIIFLLSS